MYFLLLPPKESTKEKSPQNGARKLESINVIRTLLSIATLVCFVYCALHFADFTVFLSYDVAINFTVSEPGRLDALIAAQDATYSRAKVQRLIKEGFVRVDGTSITKPAFELREGSTVTVDVSSLDRARDDMSYIESVNQNLTVLYEDDACMVLNKPAGITVHPGHATDPSEPTLLSGIRFLFEERGISFSADSVLVHRLDKPTTGCILVAKSNNSFTELQKQFEERTVQKQYIAIVSDVPEHAEATIDAPIGRNITDRTKMSILKTSKSRDAKTVYSVLGATQDCALLSCDLLTGRTHQIRVHLSSIGHPILGDATYSSPASENVSALYGVQGLCLHARKLVFTSPFDKKQHIVEAPFSATISETLQATGLNVPEKMQG